MPADDLLIKQALALTSLSENDVSTEDTSNSSTDKTSGMKFTSVSSPPCSSFFYHISENLVEALISTGKRLSIALNSAASSNTDEFEDDFSSTTSIEPTPIQRVDTTQTSVTPQLRKCILKFRFCLIFDA